MKNMLLLMGMTCSLCIYSSQKLSRDLFAYDYHSKQLQEAWFGDRVARPVCYAAVIGIMSFIVTAYVLDNLDTNRSELLGLGGFIGGAAFLSSCISLMVLKALVRLFIKNSDEESLKQMISIITLKLKNAIADGDVSLSDLEWYKMHSDCPLLPELMRYARAFRC